jgi:hypothetical protein
VHVALLVCLALTGAAPTPRERGPLEDVLVAAFRHQIAEVFATRSAQFAEDPVICVGTTEGTLPEDGVARLLKRLDAEPYVRPASGCAVVEGVAREKSSGREAVILTSGGVDWPSGAEALVEMSYYRSRRSRANLLLRVVEEPQGWIALGPTWRQ